MTVETGSSENVEPALPAGPFQVNHQLPCHAQRDVLPVVVGDQRERQVQARAQPGARPHVAVADEDRVGVTTVSGIRRRTGRR
jgi:hypothetical protein